MLTLLSFFVVFIGNLCSIMKKEYIILLSHDFH
jgi:hypothetical protein